MNYFDRHDADITLPNEDREILGGATFDCYAITVHEGMGGGAYVSESFPTSNTFMYRGKLYYFLTNFSGQISGFFKLNMEKESRCGRYFEVKSITEAA